MNPFTTAVAALIAFPHLGFSADPLDASLERLERASQAKPQAAEDSTLILSSQPAPRLPSTVPAVPAVAPTPLASPTPTTPPTLPRAETKAALRALAEAAPAADSPESAKTVWSLDPRQRISSEQAVKAGYEMTTLSVQRVLTAAGYAADASDGEKDKPLWSQRLPITVPVLYATRTLRLGPEQATKARDVLRRLQALQAKADELKAESEKLLQVWNGIVAASTPTDVLFADSATLTTNQSATPLNRENREGFQPGQGISFSFDGAKGGTK